MHLIDDDDRLLIEVWRHSPAGMGAPPLPFAGGVLDQPACVLASLAVIRSAEAVLRAKPDN